jgi:hypothetical protein
MIPLLDQLRLTAGPRREIASVLQRAAGDLAAKGLALMRLSHSEFMSFNANSDARNWYRLHDHYGHDRFLSVAITSADGRRICAVIAARPLDLPPGRSLADAFDDLSFIYPGGVPAMAADRFEEVPLQAAALRGKGVLVGGLWIDPRAGSNREKVAAGAEIRAGLGGSMLLSYLTRATAAVLLGTEDPDFIAVLVTDRMIAGHAEGRSMLRRYGYHHVAKGPIWGNHYPGQDLALNLSWIDRAGQLDVVLQTDWAGEAALAPFIPGIAAA